MTHKKVITIITGIFISLMAIAILTTMFVHDPRIMPLAFALGAVTMVLFGIFMFIEDVIDRKILSNPAKERFENDLEEVLNSYWSSPSHHQYLRDQKWIGVNDLPPNEQEKDEDIS